jgi:hypothetical protein
MARVFRTYGKNLTIKRLVQGTKEKKERVIQFLDLTTLRRLSRKNLKNGGFVPEYKDPFRIEEHWRAKFKMYNECCICGAIEEIALHHINSFRSIKNVDNHAVI